MRTFCIFKFNAKPTILNKPVSTSKKNKLLKQVKGLEQQLARMEEQFKNYNVQFQLESAEYSEEGEEEEGEIEEEEEEEEEVDEDEDIHGMSSSASSTTFSQSDHTTSDSTIQNNWKLTITSGSEGMSFQTSIKRLADVSTFLSATSQYFYSFSSPMRTPNYHIDRSLNILTVTNKMLKIEYVLHAFFQNKQKKTLLAIAPVCDDSTRIQLKRQIIHSYFRCMGRLHPLFPMPHFLPLFEADLSLMVTSAIAAFVTYTQCQHVPPIPYPMTRESLAEDFRKEAKERLDDVLFEEEPNIFIAATLLFLSQTALIILDNSEARLYMNLAWRMILELKPKYTDLLCELETTEKVQTVEMIEAETWRRLFYAIRYLEFSLYVIYDGLKDYSSILFDTGIGYPIVLQIEDHNKETRDSVEAFYQVVRINDCQLSQKDDEIKYQLFTGQLEQLSLDDLQRLENQLCEFWKSLPAHFRLSDSPFEYLDIERIQQCSNPYAIFLNQTYYINWLTLETRLMETPWTTGLEGASMDRYDGDRALLLVSICADAVAKIFYVLFHRLPCNIELHWVMVAADAMGMLKRSANPQIRARAAANLKTTLFVLKHRIQKHTEEDSNTSYGLLNSMLPSVSSPDSSSSLSTMTNSEPDELEMNEPPTFAAYFDEIGKVMDTYLDKDETAFI